MTLFLKFDFAGSLASPFTHVVTPHATFPRLPTPAVDRLPAALRDTPTARGLYTVGRPDLLRFFGGPAALDGAARVPTTHHGHAYATD